MGNALKKADPEAVQEASRFSKSTGLYSSNPKNWPDRAIKKLITHREIAPRFPGTEGTDNSNPEIQINDTHEECPICFLWYKALNTSRCCRKKICTECLLQVIDPRDEDVECPFCKHVPFKVVYLGPATEEERRSGREEEERVLKLQKDKTKHDEEEGKLADSIGADIGMNPAEHGLGPDATVGDILKHAINPDTRGYVPSQPPQGFYESRRRQHNLDIMTPFMTAYLQRQNHMNTNSNSYTYTDSVGTGGIPRNRGLMRLVDLNYDANVQDVNSLDHQAEYDFQRPITRNLRDSQREASSHRGLMSRFDDMGSNDNGNTRDRGLFGFNRSRRNTQQNHNQNPLYTPGRGQMRRASTQVQSRSSNYGYANDLNAETEFDGYQNRDSNPFSPPSYMSIHGEQGNSGNGLGMAPPWALPASSTANATMNVNPNSRRVRRRETMFDTSARRRNTIQGHNESPSASASASENVSSSQTDVAVRDSLLSLLRTLTANQRNERRRRNTTSATPNDVPVPTPTPTSRRQFFPYASSSSAASTSAAASRNWSGSGQNQNDEFQSSRQEEDATQVQAQAESEAELNPIEQYEELMVMEAIRRSMQDLEANSAGGGGGGEGGHSDTTDLEVPSSQTHSQTQTEANATSTTSTFTSTSDKEREISIKRERERERERNDDDDDVLSDAIAINQRAEAAIAHYTTNTNTTDVYESSDRECVVHNSGNGDGDVPDDEMLAAAVALSLRTEE